jgi:tetratricopeptide (TPR) repeat protein
MNSKRIIFLFCLFFINALTNAQTLDNNIYHLFLQKQYEKVIAAVKETDSLNVTNLYYAGLSAEQLEDALLSVSYLQKCIALDSTFVPAKISLAQVLFLNEEFAQAAEIYIDVLKTDSLNAFLWNNLGNCYVKLSLTPLAYSCYRNAFYLNPKNSSNTLKLISALNTLRLDNYYEESLFYCDSSLSYNPTHKPLLRRKASLFFTQREYTKADDIFEFLLRQRDSSLAVIRQAGVCKAMLNKYDDAIFLLRKAYHQSENDIPVMLYLASALSNKPDCFDETVDIIAEIHQALEPDSTVLFQTYNILAQSYLGIKDTASAIVQYYRSINPENRENRLLQMTNLANNAKPETSNTLLWYVHYYFVQNFSPEQEQNENLFRQKNFSQFLLKEYVAYMHLSGTKKVSWQTFDRKMKTLTMDDLRKLIK